MLALTTGWKPPALASLPGPFRAACHWALYVRAIVGEDGLEEVSIPQDAPVSMRLAAMKGAADRAKLRTVLYPEDEDG